VVLTGPGYARHSHADNYADVVFECRTTYCWGHSGQNVESAGYTIEHDGGLQGGSLANGYGTLRFLGGMHWVHVTATEDMNSNTFTKHIPVYVANNTTYPPTPAEIKSLRGTPEGWQVEFDILDADIAAAVPDGALVMIWAEERYSSAEGSLVGWNDREQMLFVGWLSEDRSVFDDALSDAEFLAVGPLGKLRELPMMSQSTSRNGNTTLWNIMDDNTLFKHLVYLLMWHSTVLNLCDLEEPAWVGDYPVVSLDAGQESGVSNLFDAVNGRPGADSIGARFTCDHAGQMYLRQDPVLMRSTDRQNVTVDVALQSSDWTGKIAIRRNHQLPVAWLRASAILADETEITPLLAVAPGDNPSQGGREERYDQQLAQSSDDFIRRVGRQYGRLNNPIRPFSMDILNGGLVADPAWMRYISLDLDADSNKRGISFDPDLTPQQTKAVSRLTLQAVDVTFDHDIGAMDQTWTLEPDNAGFRAKSEIVPTGDVDRAVSQPAKGIITYTPAATPEGSGVVVAADLSTIRRTADWSAATPTWAEKFDPDDWISGGTLTIQDFAIDPYNPGEGCIAAVHDTDGYLYLLRTTQLTNSSPTWSIIKTITVSADAATKIQVYLRGHTGAAGKYVLMVLDGGQWLKTYTTTDYFGSVTTWTCPDVWPAGNFTAMDASIYSNHIWVGGHDGSLYHSDNWGSSYSTVDTSDETAIFGATPADWLVNIAHIPPYNNASAATLLITQGDPTTYALGKSANSGTDWTGITPDYSGDDFGYVYNFSQGPLPLRPVATSWSDSSKIYAALARSALDVMRFFIYDSGWTMQADISSYAPYIIDVWPSDDDVVFGVGNAHLIYSEDAGENWAAKQWAGFSGGVGIWVESVG
jgi:hypothetical protein